MKKTARFVLIGVAILLALLVALSIPRKIQYKDGGTVEYKAVLWSFTEHRAYVDGDKQEAGATFRLCGAEVFSSRTVRPLADEADTQ